MCDASVNQSSLAVCRDRDNILSMAASLLACGIDHNKSVVFQQSAVCHHAGHCVLSSFLCYRHASQFSC